jgi:hypothetical protein
MLKECNETDFLHLKQLQTTWIMKLSMTFGQLKLVSTSGLAPRLLGGGDDLK